MFSYIKKIISTVDKRYFCDYRRMKYFSNFFSRLPDNNCNRGLTVAIYAGIPHMYITPFEILMYHYLKGRGCSVKYYIYGPEERCHELVTTANSGDTAGFIRKNYKRGTKFLKAAGIDFEHIEAPDSTIVQDILDRLTTINDVFTFNYDNVPLGPTVRRVVYRYYKSLAIEDKADSLAVAKCFMKTALENHLFFCSKAKEIDRVLMSHGIYCTWEPVLHGANSQGIKAVVYDRAKTGSTININFNQPSSNWSFNAAWTEYKNRRLTAIEEELVDKYITDRELQKNDVFAYNFQAKTGNSTLIREKFGLKETDKVIVFFTNLVWDAANVDRDEVFEGFDQAIIKTAMRYIDNPGVKILVRTHPAERVLGTNLRFQDMLPRGLLNIQVIEEALEINSFDVIEMADIGVVHTSTIGLEMAMAGKPVFVLGNTHYKCKGFTHDPVSIDEYFSELQKLLNYCSDNNDNRANYQNEARKYFFMMMFLYQQKIPLKYESNEFISYNYKSFMDLYFEDTVMKKIIDCVFDSNSGHFVNWD